MNKRQFLQSIKDEVRDLHPLLHSLFPKLPGIINVRYSHGSSEMGADFILERNDPFLGNTLHTGVIVKAGNISSAYQKIIEQIRECRVPRQDIDGKKITINDVMLVTNASITDKVRRQMESDAISTTVQVVDIDKLFDLLNRYLGNSWASVNVVSSVFLRDQYQRFSDLDKRLNLISTIDDLYIEPTIIEKSHDYLNSKPESEHKINLYDRIGKDKFIFLDGGFGIGKSKLLRRIAMKICKDCADSIDTIPILTSFSELLTNYSGNIKRLIEAKIPIEVASEIPPTAKYLVLIDAIDEVKINEADKMKALCSIRDEIRSSPIFIVSTSRNARNIAKKSDLSLDCKVYDLKPISTSALINYVAKACSDINLPQRLLADIKKSDLLKNLPKTPIAAILLARILKENPRDLPSTLTELYSQFAEIALGRWDIEKGLKRLIEYQTQDKCLEIIAKFMIENGLPSISKEEAIEFISRYLGKRNLPVTVEEIFRDLIERSGLVLVDESTGCFSFKHRSLMEFFFAKSESHKKSLTLDNRAFTIFWQNVFFFYFGLLGDCEEEVIALSKVKPVDLPERFMRIVFLPSYLLAAYQTPYDAISKILQELAVEFGDVYVQLRNSALNPLSGLSEMNFLWFYQMIIKSEYAYKFFENALDDMQLQI